MCATNNTYMYVARTSNNRVIAARDLYCCLLPQCEALRTYRSGFPIATQGVGSSGFFQVKPKVVKFRFTHSKLRKYSFLQKIELEKCQISKSKEGFGLPCR